MLKKIIKEVYLLPLNLIIWLYSYFSLLNNRLMDFYLDTIASKHEEKIKKIKHELDGQGYLDINLYTPNALCNYRANSFSNKEPETLEWIQEYGEQESILFDIGANIGLYSIYHSILNKGKVFAFEPSAFNLKLLVKNLTANSCSDSVKIIPNALSNKNGFNSFLYGSSVEGGALSAFGVNFDHDGKYFSADIHSKILGFSLDSMYELDLIEIPDMIKIDVDGIEHIILSGAKKILSEAKCKSVLIEVNDSFYEQSSSVNAILKECGFHLKTKTHGLSTELSKDFSSFFNQIWVK